MNGQSVDCCQQRIVHEEKVEAAKRHDLSGQGTKDLVKLFKALAEPNRLRLLHALLHEEMCVCDLAAFLGSTESSVSHQLRNLRQAGLVENRRDKTVLYYRIVDEKLKQLLQTACKLGEESV